MATFCWRGATAWAGTLRSAWFSTWRIGVAGYALRQLDPTRLDDVALPDSEQQAFALGPAALWTTGRVTMIGNVYREFATENRPEGFSAVLRLLWPI